MGAYRNERSGHLRRPARCATNNPCGRPALSPRPAATLEDELAGRRLPDVKLQYAHDAFVTLALLARRSSLLIFFYPGTKETTTPDPGQSVSADERRAVAWVRCEPELSRMGYEVIGVSAQSAIEQARFASRDPIPYMLLSDPTLKLAAILGLPTAGSENAQAYAPLALAVRNQRIARVFHLTEMSSETGAVMWWIRDHPER